jgi:type VI secretion system protein ImpE
MNAKDYYSAGQLQDAIMAQLAEVKHHPADSARRGFLCELLCFAGNLDRVDLHLDTISNQEPQSALGISLFRHLVRAEQSRQEFYTAGHLPEFLDQPTPVLRLNLEASILLREGKLQDAARLLAQAEEQRPKLAGTCDGQAFTDIRDLDDLTAPFFEVLTSNGKYYWIPMERVELVEFHAAVRPRDLLWRQAHMIVRGGPDGEVYLPTLYAGSQSDPDDQIRLGRTTDWRGGEGAPVRGFGQRTFLVGDVDRPILEMKELALTA